MLKHDNEYRAKIGMDTLIDDFEFPEMEAVLQHWPKGYVGVTKGGQPLFVDCTGQVDGPKVFENTTRERLIKWCI